MPQGFLYHSGMPHDMLISPTIYERDAFVLNFKVDSPEAMSCLDSFVRSISSGYRHIATSQAVYVEA